MTRGNSPKPYSTSVVLGLSEMMRVYCGAFGALALCGDAACRHDAPHASAMSSRQIKHRSIRFMRFIFALLLVALRLTIRTMTTAALAAVTAPQMVARGEDQCRAFPIKVLAFDERKLRWFLFHNSLQLRS